MFGPRVRARIRVGVRVGLGLGLVLSFGLASWVRVSNSHLSPVTVALILKCLTSLDGDYVSRELVILR